MKDELDFAFVSDDVMSDLVNFLIFKNFETL